VSGLAGGGPVAKETVGGFLEALSARQPVPGGGAAAGVVAAIAAGLAEMVLRYSLGKKSLADHQPLLEAMLPRLEAIRASSLRFADEDAAAYAKVNALWTLPKDDPRRLAEWSEAVNAAIEVPLRILDAAEQLLGIAKEMDGTTAASLRSDLAIAAVLGEAALRAAAWNVRINLPHLGDAARAASFERVLAAAIAHASETVGRIESHCGRDG
jgi:formiminotetrahydrofolate cyclodeaminase